MKTISVVMIVKNESKKLARCLSSVKDFANEIIIVDTGSDDDTKEIANSFNAKVFDFKWNDDFAQARNYSISKSTGDYNLILDADEYVINYDMDELQRFMSNNRKLGKVKLINLFNNKDIIDNEHIYITRFIPKGVFFARKVHEQVVSDMPRVNIPIEVKHDGYVDRDKTKFDRNINLLKLEIKNNPTEAYNYYQMAKELKGLKDYTEADFYYGKCYEMIKHSQSFYPDSIVDYLYNLINTKSFEQGLLVISNEEKNLGSYPDFYFACGNFYMDLVLSNVTKYIQYFQLIEKSYLRCIEIGETDKYTSVAGTGTFSALYNLGAFYESTGDVENALNCYTLSSDYNYLPAIDRLKVLK